MQLTIEQARTAGLKVDVTPMGIIVFHDPSGDGGRLEVTQRVVRSRRYRHTAQLYLTSKSAPLTLKPSNIQGALGLYLQALPTSKKG